MKTLHIFAVCQTDRQALRQASRQTESDRDRYRETETDRNTDRQTDRQTARDRVYIYHWETSRTRGQFFGRSQPVVAEEKD